jgi:hypothetical protein
MSIGSLCRTHNKHQARTGSAFHRGLKPIQCQAYRQVIHKMLREELSAKQWDTTLMVQEWIATIHALPSNTPRLHEMARTTPLLKAQAI